jgi:hypothetical protein
MNQHSTETSASSNVAPDAVSRRAYELWENEGRPEGCDMRHWLQAEQELAQGRNTTTESERTSIPARNSDVTPLQGTRAGAAANASRDTKRPPTTPTSNFGGEKNGNGGGQSAARRKSASTPAL